VVDDMLEQETETRNIGLAIDARERQLALQVRVVSPAMNAFRVAWMRRHSSRISDGDPFAHVGQPRGLSPVHRQSHTQSAAAACASVSLIEGKLPPTSRVVCSADSSATASKILSFAQAV
jgi:hypothetical protein